MFEKYDRVQDYECSQCLHCFCISFLEGLATPCQPGWGSETGSEPCISVLSRYTTCMVVQLVIVECVGCPK